MKKKICLFITTMGLLLTACSSKASVSNSTESTVTASENSQAAVEEIAPMPTEDIVPEPVESTEESFDTTTPYGNLSHYIEFLGLKEYASLGDGNVTDTPSEGNVYLVLFLNLENRTDVADYINPYYVSATIDGTVVENTVLLNDPEGYSTLFTHVSPQDSLNGFIVWEVPESWTTLEFDFDNWENTDHVLLHAVFTKDDLADPEPLNE